MGEACAMMGRIPSIASLIAIGVALIACVAHGLPPTSPPTRERPTFTSTVLNVSDGDTLTLLGNGAGEKVRLNGIR